MVTVVFRAFSWVYHADDVPIFVNHAYRLLEDIVVEIEALVRDRLGGAWQPEWTGLADIDDIAEISQRLDRDGAKSRTGTLTHEFAPKSPVAFVGGDGHLGTCRVVRASGRVERLYGQWAVEVRVGSAAILQEAGIIPYNPESQGMPYLVKDHVRKILSTPGRQLRVQYDIPHVWQGGTMVPPCLIYIGQRRQRMHYMLYDKPGILSDVGFLRENQPWYLLASYGVNRSRARHKPASPAAPVRDSTSTKTTRSSTVPKKRCSTGRQSDGVVGYGNIPQVDRNDFGPARGHLEGC